MSDLKDLRARIISVAEGNPEIRSVHNIDALSMVNTLCVTMHCTVDRALTLDQAHEMAKKLEKKIKSMDALISQAIIHCEPRDLRQRRSRSSVKASPAIFLEVA